MLYQMTVTQFTKMLKNLNQILDKGNAYADQKKFPFEALLNSRLAPDQFNLIRQVQIACDTAKGCAASLTGGEAPTHEDNEKTLDELKVRIKKVITYLETFSTNDFRDAADRKITRPRWEGKYLTGIDFATTHAIPNMYFHITTAYSILRNNGVDLGKKDYLGELPFIKNVL